MCAVNPGKSLLLLCFSILYLCAAGLQITASAGQKTAAGDNRDACMYGKGGEAIEACAEAIKSAPANSALLLKYTDRLMDAKQFEEARKAVEEVLALEPRHKKAAYKLKEIDSYLKEKKWAEERAKKASARNRREGSSQFKLDKIRCLKLKGEKALQSCNTLIKAFGDNHTYYIARGRILADMGRKKQAEQDFRLAAKYNPAFQKAKAEGAEQLALATKTPVSDPVIPTISAADKKVIVPQEGSPKIDKESPVATASAVEVGSTPVGGNERQVSSGIDTVTAVKVEGSKPTAAQSGGSMDELTGKLVLLQSLYDQGFIDEKEFTVRKKKLLDSVFPPSPKKDVAGKSNSPIDASKLGQYHALIIGVQDYTDFPKLETPLKDARDVKEVLGAQYGFTVRMLVNPTRRDIILALQDYRKQLEYNDNLLIYYAGHGWLDEEADAGYWLPVEAVPENDVDWLSLNSIVSAVRAVEAKHVLVVADSCFSGKLTRGLSVARPSPSHFEKIAKKRARVVLTSGGLEPVLDSGGKHGNSVFADAFLAALKENTTIMDGATLFTKIRRPVMLKAQQTPQYSDIRRALHEGGDFIFQKVAQSQ